MKTIRIGAFALAVLLPAAWTVARAGDDAAATTETKTTKKTKKSKKDDGSTKTETEKTETIQPFRDWITLTVRQAEAGR